MFKENIKHKFDIVQGYESFKTQNLMFKRLRKVRYARFICFKTNWGSYEFFILRINLAVY